MSESESNRRRPSKRSATRTPRETVSPNFSPVQPPERNESWLHSDSARRTLSPTVEQTFQRVRNSVSRVIEAFYSTASSPEPEAYPDVTVNPTYETDENQTLTNNEQDSFYLRPRRTRSEGSARSDIHNTHRREFSLTSYDSSVFDPTEFYAADRDMENQPPGTPRGDATAERQVTYAELDAEISAMRNTVAQPHWKRDRTEPPRDATNDALAAILDGLRGLQDRISRLEVNRPNGEERNTRANPPEITYGRTQEDIRNTRGPINNYMKLKEARDMIPEIDGNSRNQVQKFINASTFAMRQINPADELSLLQAILCTKLTGRAMYDFQTRDIHSFAQLKQEIETCYLTKRGTTHIQRDFNLLRQKANESAREYGLRVDKLAMELYQSMVEGKTHTTEQRKAILDTIQSSALENFQLGLKEDIQTIVRSRNYTNLPAAILGATTEEKLKGTGPKRNQSPERTKNGQGGAKTGRNPGAKSGLKCHKCEKMGHIARECRSSRPNNKFALPKADKVSANVVEKYCNYCKKAGHSIEECWSKNRRQNNNRPTNTQRDNRKRRHVNTTAGARKTRTPPESEDVSSSSGTEEEERESKAKPRAKKEYRVTQMTCTSRANAGLDFVTLPVEQAKKGKISFLLDTGATITLVKIGQLKKGTLIREKRLALTGVTGHQIHTLGKLKANVSLGDREIKHSIYVVENDFPIEYEGILGINFLTKHQAKCDHGKKQMRIGETAFKLHANENVTLTPRSETIIQARTDKNKIGIIKAKEAKPGVFIGSCIVRPENNTCPISIINTTEEAVEITTPDVTVEEIEPSTHADRAKDGR